MLARADVLGPLEHHVLEQMREPGAPLALVARADVVVDDDREHRRGVILRDDHAQAVLELGVGELDRLDGRGGKPEVATSATCERTAQSSPAATDSAGSYTHAASIGGPHRLSDRSANRFIGMHRPSHRHRSIPSSRSLIGASAHRSSHRHIESHDRRSGRPCDLPAPDACRGNSVVPRERQTRSSCSIRRIHVAAGDCNSAAHDSQRVEGPNGEFLARGHCVLHAAVRPGRTTRSIADQLLGAGTAVDANYGSAQCGAVERRVHRSDSAGSRRRQ